MYLDEPFSTIVCGDEVSMHKPSPEPYLTAVGRLDLTPSACLAVEDSVPGANSALAAGMSVVGFTGFDVAVGSIPQFRGLIADFREESPASLRSLHR